MRRAQGDEWEQTTRTCCTRFDSARVVKKEVGDPRHPFPSPSLGDEVDEVNKVGRGSNPYPRQLKHCGLRSRIESIVGLFPRSDEKSLQSQTEELRDRPKFRAALKEDRYFQRQLQEMLAFSTTCGACGVYIRLHLKHSKTQHMQL